MSKGDVNVHDSDDFALVVIRRGTNETQVQPDDEAHGGSAANPALKPSDCSNHPVNGHRCSGIHDEFKHPIRHHQKDRIEHDEEFQPSPVQAQGISDEG